MSSDALSFDPAAIMGGLYGDGIIELKGAFSPKWAEQLGRDIDALFADALTRPGGAVGRGPKRYYVEIHPERISGFVDLATHPWVDAVCQAVLGPDYIFVEIGFDVSLPGAINQPWHRDFPATDETPPGRRPKQRRINSLAFDLTTVDVKPDMGPFEIAYGTQWDIGNGFYNGMFPDPALWERYEARAQRKMPQKGDISARSPLNIHRSTANQSNTPRPALVLRVDTPDINPNRHELQFSRAFYEKLPPFLRDHLTCRMVDELEPNVQAHTIEGLVMGEA